MRDPLLAAGRLTRGDLAIPGRRCRPFLACASPGDPEVPLLPEPTDLRMQDMPPALRHASAVLVASLVGPCGLLPRTRSDSAVAVAALAAHAAAYMAGVCSPAVCFLIGGAALLRAPDRFLCRRLRLWSGPRRFPPARAFSIFLGQSAALFGGDMHAPAWLGQLRHLRADAGAVLQWGPDNPAYRASLWCSFDGDCALQWRGALQHVPASFSQRAVFPPAPAG